MAELIERYFVAENAGEIEDKLAVLMKPFMRKGKDKLHTFYFAKVGALVILIEKINQHKSDLLMFMYYQNAKSEKVQLWIYLTKNMIW